VERLELGEATLDFVALGLELTQTLRAHVAELRLGFDALVPASTASRMRIAASIRWSRETETVLTNR
jgi:hypothetical protein